MSDELVSETAAHVLELDTPYAKVATPNAPKKKRSRSKSGSSGGGSGVVVVADRFVCSYSARVTSHAVFIPGVDTASFANVPCAFAWLEDVFAGTEETRDQLKKAICDEYDQQVNTVQRAPKRDYLVDFGGDKYYDEWIGELIFWDKLTEASGSTVSEWKTRGKGTATKRGKGSNSRVTFAAAQYSVAYNKGAAGCKQVNAVDGVATEKGAKNVLTPAKALRKLGTFITTQQGEAKVPSYKKAYFEGESWIAVALVPVDAAQAIDNKLRNHIATQLVGATVYGPAVVTFTRKHSLKI